EDKARFHEIISSVNLQRVIRENKLALVVWKQMGSTALNSALRFGSHQHAKEKQASYSFYRPSCVIRNCRRRFILGQTALVE
ncbi:MAG TPA: hypothetical protein VGB77_10620, partial [Abditibacteriaceae bacterium]